VNHLEIENVPDRNGHFEELLGLCRGDSLEVTSGNLVPLLQLCASLVNRELSELLIKFWPGEEEMSLSNVIERILMKSFHSTDFSSEVNFLAAHLSEFDVKLLSVLDYSVIDEIISSESLRIENEDFLLDLVFSLGHLSLLGRVKCAFLSVSGIDRLLGCVSLSSVSSDLWASLCDRLRCPLEQPRVNKTRYDCPGRFGYQQTPFSGILAHLSSICGGNVHDRGEVEITCSSPNSDECRRIVDYDDGTKYWVSSGSPNSWICIDFKTRRVRVNHYSPKGPSSGCYPTDWLIEGSNDGSAWVTLDERHTDSLIGSLRSETFACSSSTRCQQQRFRQLRWRMTDKGKDYPGEKRCCHFAKLRNIEFFGSLSSIPD
jgi:hypothetical protein